MNNDIEAYENMIKAESSQIDEANIAKINAEAAIIEARAVKILLMAVLKIKKRRTFYIGKSPNKVLCHDTIIPGAYLPDSDNPIDLISLQDVADMLKMVDDENAQMLADRRQKRLICGDN